MALQKRRLGRTRVHHRRSNWMRRAGKPALVQKCQSCDEPKMPHRVCLNCGHYDGKQIIELQSDADE